ncbi:MAG: ADOP family duplicated permease, partial [Acidobacteriota bacterium]
VLGAQPLQGRAFHSDEGRQGAAPVAVISESLWRGRLGATEAILGMDLMLDDEPHTVVGVMPEAFDFLLGTVELWVPADFTDEREERADRSLIVTGRLARDISIVQAQDEMSAIAARLEARFPETNEGWEVELQAVDSVFPGKTDTRLAQILMVVVVMVLLVACVNVASLLLAKSDARHKEVAVRVALGAGKGRLLRQMLTESVLMALLAGALGAFLSIWGVRGVAGSMPDMMPTFYAPSLDAAVLSFCLLISLLAGLTFGISPALQALRGSLLAPLLDSQRGTTSSREKKRMLSTFVVAEFALALTILIGAAVMSDIFHQALDIDPGFDSENLLTLQLELPEHRFADEDATRQFTERLGEALEGVGGTSATTLVSDLPRTRNLSFTELLVDGQPMERNEAPQTSWLAIRPGYFQAMGVDLLDGRGFATSDDADAAPVIVVNQELVDRHLGAADAETGRANTSPIGRRLTVQGASREIIGVVANVTQGRMAGLEPLEPAVYFPLAQQPVRRLHAMVRATAGDPYALTAPIQQAIWQLDPAQPISQVKTVDEHVAAELAGPTMISQVLFFVGVLALVLAAMGIFGVMTFSVSQQTGEIGLRMALGARPGQILGRVTRQGARLAGIGLFLGIPASAGVVALVASLFEAAASDGLTAATTQIPLQPILEVGGLLAVVGLLACYLPARRATRIDPVSALQSD